MLVCGLWFAITSLACADETDRRDHQTFVVRVPPRIAVTPRRLPGQTRLDIESGVNLLAIVSSATKVDPASASEPAHQTVIRRGRVTTLVMDAGDIHKGQRLLILTIVPLD